MNDLTRRSMFGTRPAALWRGVWTVLVLAAFAVRLYQLDGQDLWWDEARNLDVAARPLAQIAVAGELDAHPPLYFYLLHGWWRLVRHGPAPTGADAFAVRFLSLSFGVLLVPFLAALGRRLGGPWVGTGAAVAAAALPFLVGEAQETRMYTMLLVSMTVTGLALVRATTGQIGRLCPWIGFGLGSALALLTHYAAVFALTALWAWAGLWALTGGRARLWRRLRGVMAAGLTAALLCLPALPIALRQMAPYRNPNLIVPSVTDYLTALARVYTLGEHIEPAAARPWLIVLTALLVGGWVSGLTWQSWRRAGRSLALSLAWAVVPILLYYPVIADRGTFATRYIAAALPGWLLLTGWAIAGWERWGRMAAAAAILALAVCLAPGVVGDLTDERFFREDTRGLAAWLRQETDPAHDLILLDQRYPFGLYWPRWNNQHNGFPPDTPADWTPAQYLFVDLNTLADRLTQLTHGRRRVFLVRWFESDTDPRGAATWLLEKFGAPLGERAFRGYRVTWYAIAADTRFELAPALAETAVAFGEQVQLAAYAFGGRGPGLTSTLAETRAAAAPADRPIWAVLRWAPLSGAAPSGRYPRGLKATLVLADAEGEAVGHDDRPILNDRHQAPAFWVPGDRPLGVHLVRAEPATPPGTYTLKLAVYDPETLAPLPAVGPATQGVFAILGQVTLTRPTQPAVVADLPIAAPANLSWRGLRLLGGDTPPATAAPGDRLTLTLFWQVEGASLPALRVRFDLIPQATAAASWETAPVPGYPTSLWQTGDVWRGRVQLPLDPTLPTGLYRLELRLTDGAAVSPAAVLGTVELVGRSHVFAPPATMGRRLDARFGDLATLLGYDLTPPATRADPLRLTLYWRAEATAAIPYAVSVQLLDGHGVLRAQRDQQPGDGTLATTGWVPGEILTDPYRLDLPADLPAGTYTLIVKLYNPATGQTLPVTSAEGNPIGDYLPLEAVAIP
ncbi:MAG: glycosyltransferase family 39 protein [Caldilineales bacterium]|nr:glycosyltransferase family 39 protein [Caldilineales bacterium]